MVARRWYRWGWWSGVSGVTIIVPLGGGCSRIRWLCGSGLSVSLVFLLLVFLPVPALGGLCTGAAEDTRSFDAVLICGLVVLVGTCTGL